MEMAIKANIKSIFMKHDLIHFLEIHSKCISKMPTMMLSNKKNVKDKKLRNIESWFSVLLQSKAKSKQTLRCDQIWRIFIIS